MLLFKAVPGILVDLTITFASLVGHSAMASTIGGGGLGDLGTRYGYQRYESDIMLAIVIILIIFMQTVQSVSD